MCVNPFLNKEGCKECARGLPRRRLHKHVPDCKGLTCAQTCKAFTAAQHKDDSGDGLNAKRFYLYQHGMYMYINLFSQKIEQ